MRMPTTHSVQGGKVRPACCAGSFSPDEPFDERRLIRMPRGEYLFPAEGCPGANSAPQSVGSNALLAGRVAPKVIAAESVEEGRPRELRCRITADRNRFNRCTILSVSPMTVRKHFQPGDPISETAVYAVVRKPSRTGWREARHRLRFPG